MQKPISLGALIKSTEEYVYPKLAVKGGSYICPECRHDLILCKGTKVSPYFRHRSEQRPCNHYTNPGESQIHKDAKLMLKTALEKKVKITIRRKCPSCKTTDEYEIPEVSDTSCVEVEHRFDYNGLKIADVAYLDNNEPVCMFEIYNTHATSTDKRPEPWFEFDAKALIINMNVSTSDNIVLDDIRTEDCDMCREYKHNPDELFVRKTLGQTTVEREPDPDYNYVRQKHLKFDFDARHSYNGEEYNKGIMSLFNGTQYKNGIFGEYRTVIYSSKGWLTAAIVSKPDYYKYDYWNDGGCSEKDMKYPYVEFIDYLDYGTVDIIVSLMKRIKELDEINRRRIAFERRMSLMRW
jgi:hypothetical protein